MASTDRDVLLVLHRSTGGANWRNNTNWDTDVPIGDWHGVEVKDDGSVVKLDLASNNLRGDIPAILGKLKLLKTLILSDNTLTGSIPPELGEMESLEVLDLGSNKLTGHIPDQLGQLGVSIRTNAEESFTDAGNRSGHQTFAPDLYAEGIGSDPEDERDHWSSEPLEPLHELQYVSFLWRDQGWGNRKGTLFLSLDPGSTDQQSSTQEPKEHRQLMPDPAEHEWTHEVMEIDPKDPLRRLACAGDRYRLSFIAGGGGGHILQARRFTLHFSVAGGSCGDELYFRVLWKIDLRNNKLTGSIPQDLSNLRDLGVLRLGSNGLSGAVPSALVRLERLFDVDLSDNELSVLPMDLTAKWALAVQDDNRKVGVSVNGNPWVRPPRAFLARGLVSAGRWWDGIARFGEGTSSKLKMVLVGLAEAGKTTIVRHFTGGDPADKRTIGVELSEWKPNKNLPLEVSLWDFSGQSDYHASHQIFLTEGALFLLVVDLFELGRDEKSAGIPDPRGAIYRWLDILHERVPGAVVALVGTHGDKFFPRPPPSSESAGDEDLENRIDNVLKTLLEILAGLLRQERAKLGGQLSADEHLGNLLQLVRTRLEPRLSADDLGNLVELLRTQLEGHVWGDEELDDLMRLVQTTLVGHCSADDLASLAHSVQNPPPEDNDWDEKSKFEDLVQLAQTHLEGQLSADDLCDVLQWVRTRNHLGGRLSAEGLGDLVQLVRTNLEGQLSAEDLGNLVQRVRVQLRGQLSAGDLADGLVELVHSNLVGQLSADDLDDVLRWLRARLEGHLSADGLGDVVQLVRTNLEGQLSVEGLGNLYARVRINLEGQLSDADLADGLVELVQSKMEVQLSADDLDNALQWLRARLEGHLSAEGLGDLVQLVRTNLEGQLSAEHLGNLLQRVRTHLEGQLAAGDLADGLVELVDSKLVGQLSADDLDDVLRWLRARLEGHLSAEGLGDVVQLVRTNLEGQLSAEGIGNLVQLVRNNLEGHLSDADLADGLVQLVHSKLVGRLSADDLDDVLQWLRARLEGHLSAEGLGDIVQLIRTNLDGQLSAEGLGDLVQLVRNNLGGLLWGTDPADGLLQLVHSKLVCQLSVEGLHYMVQFVRTKLEDQRRAEDLDDLVRLVRTRLQGQLSAEELDILLQLLRTQLEGQILGDEELDSLLQLERTTLVGQLSGPRYAEEIKNGQRQLHKAEKRFRTLVRQYQEDKAKELKLSCGNASAEKDDSFQRGSTPPLILHPRVFCASLGLDNRIGRLSDWIIGVATEKISFSFPAVATILPSAWVDAIAAVDALHKEKGAPYVLWGDAVKAFRHFFQEKHKDEGKEERNKPLSDKEATTNLKEAMKHREAEGGVILSLREESSPAQSDIIHVDPRWLIELVRRVTDHNLVDKKQENEILQELLEYDRTRPDSLSGYKNLCETHACFIRQGRLNREYLRFLWVHRKLEIEGDYAGAQLDNDAFDSMVDTMIKYLFIYPSHGECIEAEDFYIVPARLPEYGNDNVLEESIGLGEVVVGKTAWFLRSHAPTGIIGRFLAFTSSRFEASGECWQHGAHIQWKKDSNEHDVLLCETTIEKDIIPGQSTFPAIAICVKGKTAEAKGVLREVGEQLLSLLQDNIHGYPGLRLPIFEELNITQSDQFQVHFERYLATKLATILEDTRRESVRMFRAAFPSYDDPVELLYPRLVLLKPVETTSIQETQAEESVNGAIQLRRTWDRWIDLCRSGGSCDFVLVFLCERDFSEIPCGPQGKGFRVHNPGSLFNTLKPLLQGALWLVKIAVGTVASVDLPLHDVLEAFLHATATEVLEAAPSQFSPSATLDEGQQEGFKELHGPAYKALCDFMRKEEFGPEEAQCRSCLPWHRPRVHEPIPSEFDWRSHMEMIQNGIGYSWVRKSSEQ